MRTEASLSHNKERTRVKCLQVYENEISSIKSLVKYMYLTRDHSINIRKFN